MSLCNAVSLFEICILTCKTMVLAPPDVRYVEILLEHEDLVFRNLKQDGLHRVAFTFSSIRQDGVRYQATS